MQNQKIAVLFEEVSTIYRSLKIPINNIYMPEMIALCFDLIKEYSSLSAEDRNDDFNLIRCLYVSRIIARCAYPGMREKVNEYITTYECLTENKITIALQRNRHYERIIFS